MATRQPRNQPPRSEAVPSELGKMPPQSLELEEAILGAIMLEKHALLTVIDLLKPESFYKDAHQKIFGAILQLSRDEKPIDILTVTEELRATKILEEVGGPAYISQLTSRVASSAHIEYHARIVAQKFIQRELIRASSEIQKQAYDESIDVHDLLEFSEKQLFDIATGNIKKESLPISTLITEAIKRIEEAGKREDNLSGVPSGFTKLDRVTSGWQRSDLVIIAARPSMGKTAFVLSMSRNMALDHKRPIAIFSLEMASVQLVNRLIVSETELPSERIRNGKLSPEEWKQLDSKIRDLVSAPLYIDDTPAISIYELRAKCRRLKMQHDIQLIVIDYLQLMTAPVDNKGSREQEVSNISRSLKALAKELDVPVIALSQLNRSVETRSGNKRPQLSDLRESGAIEQDADIVIFIHRPEKYGLFEDIDGNSTKGIAEIIIAKHRNGATSDLQLRFREDLAKFEDLDAFAPIAGEFLPGSSAITIGSRMNQEVDERNKPFSLNRNERFDEETPF
jgi:replicative DNA helicase